MPVLHLTLPPPGFETNESVVAEITREFAAEMRMPVSETGWTISDFGTMGPGFEPAGLATMPRLVVDIVTPAAASTEHIKTMCRSLTAIAARRVDADPSQVMVEYRNAQWF